MILFYEEDGNWKEAVLMGFKITIAGLGLMGASLAKALRGWRNAAICGVETNAAVLERALAEGVIDSGYVLDETNAEEALDADLVVIALWTSCAAAPAAPKRARSGAT